MLNDKESPEFGERKQTPPKVDGVQLSRESMSSNITGASFLDVGATAHFLANSGNLSPTKDLSVSLNEAVASDSEFDHDAESGAPPAARLPLGGPAQVGGRAASSVEGHNSTSAAHDAIASAHTGLAPIVGPKISVQESVS